MTLLWNLAQSSGATVDLGGARATMDNNNGPGQGGILGAIGKSSGKWCCQVNMTLFDGFCIGLSSANGANFPGLIANGMGFFSSGIGQNNGSGFSVGGAGGPNIGSANNILILFDLNGMTMQLCSADNPQGANVYSLGWTPGTTVYPSIGMTYGNGASHLCDGIIYGDPVHITVPHTPDFLPLGGDSNSGFFALL